MHHVNLLSEIAANPVIWIFRNRAFLDFLTEAYWTGHGTPPFPAEIMAPCCLQTMGYLWFWSCPR